MAPAPRRRRALCRRTITAARPSTGAQPLRPTVAPAPFEEAELLGKLIDLHRAGVLDETELAAKTAVVGELARRAGSGHPDPLGRVPG